MSKRLARFKCENKKKENTLHKKARRMAREVGKTFGIKVLEEYIKHPFILDLYIKELRIGIEIDGGIHKDREQKDITRDNYLKQKHRIDVFRFNKTEVSNGVYRNSLWFLFYRSFLEKIKTINEHAVVCGREDCIPEEIKHLRLRVPNQQ